MATIYNTWEDQGEDSQYPFEDRAALNSPDGLELSGVVADAILIGASAIVKLSVSATSVEIYSDSGAKGTYNKASPSDVIQLRLGSAPAGVLQLSDAAAGIINSWPIGEFTFNASVVMSCRVPAPKSGLRKIVADGVEFSGHVYIVGEQGVRLTYDSGAVRVDIIGDARSEKKFCGTGEASVISPVVLSVNNRTPDADGRFKLLVTSTQTSQPSLAVAQSGTSLVIGRR